MNASRKMLVVSHNARREAVAATSRVVSELLQNGVRVVMSAADRADFTQHIDVSKVQTLGDSVQLEELELAIVLGGDGTILRAAELVTGSSCPIIGVNLGHVGFLAEMERHDLRFMLQRVLDADYTVEEREKLAVAVYRGEELVHETFAVNEATVEKTERMIEIAIGVDGRALSAFGCDGVVMASVTGSTAYAFSAGGPVVWPGVDGMLLVPIAAHALFNRPLVVGPQQVLEAQLSPDSPVPAQLWCDGRRRFELQPGHRVVVRRSRDKLRLARLQEAVFTDRLVQKFHLPTSGWRQLNGGDGR